MDYFLDQLDQPGTGKPLARLETLTKTELIELKGLPPDQLSQSIPSAVSATRDQFHVAVIERYVGPWFITQLVLSLSIGLTAFITFCFARRVERWKVLYSPRTLLKGESTSSV